MYAQMTNFENAMDEILVQNKIIDQTLNKTTAMEGSQMMSVY